MRLRRVRRVGFNHWVVAGLLLIGASYGRVEPAASSELPEALQACMQEPDDSRRLTCYDRETGRAVAAHKSSFGLSAQQEHKLQAAGPHAEPKPQLLSSIVAAVSSHADGRQLIRLANGETWLQGEAWEAFPISVGDAVTIKPGMLGSFYLYVPSGRATRVTRMQ